ncbi:MAG: hypothetical protein JWO41_782 [Candidatus Saccharibacteria bacterium]|nr:hypothetical protein [Candidatus Saccharibacteria bacterium]
MSQERITGVLTDWLRAEIVEADTGRNAPLSKHEQRRAELFKPVNDPLNQHASKLHGHHRRIKLLMEQMDLATIMQTEDSTAKLSFYSMMFISGNYRSQCMIEAETEDEYKELRYSRPVGIDLAEVVVKTLGQKSSIVLEDPDARLAKLSGQINRVNYLNKAMHEDVHAALAGSEVRQIDAHLTPSEVFQNAQQMWASLAVAEIMVAASFRDDDFALVPFYQPASITDQTELIYPF